MEINCNVAVDDILNMTLDEFVMELNEDEKDYIVEKSPYDFWTAVGLYLEQYQDGARAYMNGYKVNGEPEGMYIDIHQYIQLSREQDMQ